MKKTIFEFGVTNYELDRLVINCANPENYFQNVSEWKKLYDLFLLFRIRGDEQSATSLWENTIKDRFVVKPIN